MRNQEVRRVIFSFLKPGERGLQLRKISSRSLACRGRGNEQTSASPRKRKDKRRQITSADYVSKRSAERERSDRANSGRES